MFNQSFKAIIQQYPFILDETKDIFEQYEKRYKNAFKGKTFIKLKTHASGFVKCITWVSLDSKSIQSSGKVLVNKDTKFRVTLHHSLFKKANIRSNHYTIGGTHMKLVILIGNAAVGKMTTGQALMDITKLRLFHNHMTIEPVIKIFGYFNGEVISQWRDIVFDAYAKSDAYGLIFTYMWAFDQPSDHDYIQKLHNKFKKQWCRSLFR